MAWHGEGDERSETLVDGEWLSISEAANRVGVGQDKMREIADAGIVRSLRPPRTGPGHPHRRLSAADVDELASVMQLPSPDREVKLEELRRRNRGTASPEQAGEAGKA